MGFKIRGAIKGGFNCEMLHKTWRKGYVILLIVVAKQSRKLIESDSFDFVDSVSALKNLFQTRKHLSAKQCPHTQPFTRPRENKRQEAIKETTQKFEPFILGLVECGHCASTTFQTLSSDKMTCHDIGQSYCTTMLKIAEIFRGLGHWRKCTIKSAYLLLLFLCVKWPDSGSVHRGCKRGADLGTRVVHLKIGAASLCTNRLIHAPSSRHFTGFKSRSRILKMLAIMEALWIEWAWQYRVSPQRQRNGFPYILIHLNLHK